ncbi:MAG: exodeoxyribonuclease V subunit alpha [Balneola sp.]
MYNIISLLEDLKKKEEITLQELEFAHYLLQIGEESDLVIGAGIAVMHYHLNGHICASISDIHGFLSSKKLVTVSASELVTALKESPLVGNGSSLTPFVFENELLYLHKYWKYELELSNWLNEKAKVTHQIQESDLAEIDGLFKDSGENDWQKVAVQLSHCKDLVIITGSPGTGKTYTVKKIIESHLKKDSSLRIALAAPTGKAAQRLNEVFSEEFPDEIEPAKTIHSLLEAKGVSGEFRFNEDRTLPYDFLIIDEASMMDIYLWISLIRATSIHTKLILLGDKNQLASVEAGSILGDICSGSTNSFSEQISSVISVDFEGGDSASGINDSIVELVTSRRFGKSSGIGILSEAIIKGNDESVIRMLQSKEFPDIQFKEASNQSISELLEKYVLNPFREMKKNGFSHEGYKEYQILCALRKGPYGVEELNRRSELAIRDYLGISTRKFWYDGRPIILTRNQWVLNLRNGETGFAMPDNSENGFVLNFESRESKPVTSRLSDFESSFAITVHKSQGSEYDHVAIILSNTPNRVLSRQLLYTAVTRARKSVLVIGNTPVISSAVQHSVVRRSGLREKIRNK